MRNFGILRRIGLALAAVAAAGCVEFNTECSPPIPDPDKEIFWLAEPVPVARATVRTKESALGNALTDGYRAAVQELRGGRVGITAAFENAGAIRDLGLCVTRTNLAKGPVLRRVLRDVLAFSNELYVVNVTEPQLFEILEHSVAAIAKPGTLPSGQFLQVSGLSYTVDCSRPYEGKDGQPGSRVLEVVFDDNRRITPQTASTSSTMAVVFSSYIAQGGDGYKTLGERSDSDREKTGRFTYAVAEQYLAGLGPDADHPARLPLDPEKPRIDLRNCE